MWQVKDLREAIFGSVASKGLTDESFGSVANTRLSGVFRGSTSLSKKVRGTARREDMSVRAEKLCPVSKCSILQGNFLSNRI